MSSDATAGSSDGTYGAFVSYSHADRMRAAWLQRKLEAYRTPKGLQRRAGPYGPIPASVGRVYRDTTDFAAGPHLEDAIRRALDGSRTLIVVCSPAAAKSRYVDAEIRHFQSLGRGARIFPIIVDGTVPDCFPAALLVRGEPIAADARPGLGDANRAVQKLLAGILGVDHDDIVRRQAIAQRWRTRGALGLAAVFAGLAMVSTVSALSARDSAERSRRSERTAVTEKGRAQVARAEAERQRDLAIAASAREAAQRKRADAEAGEAARQGALALAQRDAARVAESQATATLARLEADGQNWGGAFDIAASRLQRPDLTPRDRRQLEGTLVQASANDRRMASMNVDLKSFGDGTAAYLEGVAFDPDAKTMLVQNADTMLAVRTSDGAVLARNPDSRFLRGFEFDPASGSFVGASGFETLCVGPPAYKVAKCPSGVKVPRRRTVAPPADGRGVYIRLPQGGRSHVAARPSLRLEVVKGQPYAFAYDDRTVSIWRLDVPEAEMLFEFDITQTQVYEHPYAFSGDGKRAAVAPGGAEILLLDLARRTVTRLVGHSSFVVGLEFDDETGTLVSFGHEMALRRWRLGPPPRRWTGAAASPIRVAAVDGAGAYAIAGLGEAAVAFGSTSASLKTATLGSSQIRQVAVQGTTGVVGQSNGALSALDLRTGRSRSLPGHAAAVLDLAVATHAPLLVSGGADDVALLQNLETGKVLCRIAFTRHVQGVSFGRGPPGHFLTISEDEIVVWRIEGCAKSRTYRLGDAGPVAAVDFDPSTGRVLIGTDAGDVLFAGSADTTLQTIGRLPHSVAAVTLKDGGSALSGDGSVRLLDLGTRTFASGFQVADGAVDGGTIAPEAPTVFYWRGREMAIAPLQTDPRAILASLRAPSKAAKGPQAGRPPIPRLRRPRPEAPISRSRTRG